MKDFNWHGFELITAVLGFIGAALGISYSPPMTKKEMFAALLAGVVCAVLGPQLVAQIYQLPSIVNNALAFTFGIGGMFIVPGLLTMWREFGVNPFGFIDRLRGVKRDEDKK
ncbi:MAG: hypothetical protein ACK5XE_08310 [Burkholderiales bacterium]|jgi:energy-converting hydrogenase Eha subunit C